jgi:hypothetical protein
MLLDAEVFGHEVGHVGVSERVNVGLMLHPLGISLWELSVVGVQRLGVHRVGV